MASKIDVLIVGGGLAGLMMAICLSKANIAYQIVDRTATIRPLGAAIGIASSVAPMLQQLGLYDDIVRLACKLEKSHIMDDGKLIGTMEYAYNEKRYGYGVFILSRYELFKLLLSKIPASRIHFNKRVLSILQSDEGIMVRCSDGSSIHASVLIGADGAKSAVRSSLYDHLQDRHRLPSTDAEPLVLTASCLVGTTNSLDPKKFPKILQSSAIMDVCISKDRPYRVTLFTIPGNRISWIVVKTINTFQDKSDAFRFSEWGSENAKEMIEDTKDLPMSFGNTVDGFGVMGDFYENTEPEGISKVMLEEKIFETWYHDRVVLIGDACHKMTPAAGLGMAQAFLDCVSLANQLNELKDDSTRSIAQAFKAYRQERFDIANDAVNQSRQFGILFGGKSAKDRLTRKLLLQYLPQWVHDKMNQRLQGSKPQLRYLPFVEELGVVKNSPVQTQSSRMAPMAL